MSGGERFILHGEQEGKTEATEGDQYLSTGQLTRYFLATVSFR